ncbi:MAG TPA: calcium-binding protein, partial [Thermoleophilaceae bacterium]
VWNGGDDDDTMNGGDGTDTIEVNGSPVAGEQFAVKPSATAGRVQFDRLGPNPPGAFNLDIGTSEKLDLRMNGGDDNFTADAGLDALGFKLQVDGGDGNDVIDGGDGADLLRGGNGDDRVIGDDNPANTRDLSYGDAGNDTLVWNGGDDDDVNDGGDGNDTIEVNGSPVAGEQFEVKPSATPGHVQFDRLGPSPTPGTFNLDIVTSERLDLRMNGGDDTVTAASGLEPLGLHLDVTGGDGNDSIDGSDSADLLSGGNGNDRITADDNPPGTQDVANGDAGDDTFVWNPGDDDDVNEGGDGNDTVEVNGATAGEKFTVKPSATAGRVQFDRVSPDPKFSIDIGTSENLHVNGGDGDDTILGSKGLAGLIASTFNGDAGNDTIKGSDGADKVSGGKGSDLIVTRDRAGDEVECNGGFDLALVDRRDRVRGCEIVLGGRLRVKHVGSSLTVHGGAAALKLRCVATAKCRGTAALLYHGKSLGKVRFNLKSGKAKTYRIDLNRRGHRLLAASSKARKVVLRIDAKDNMGNGWRTSDRIKLKG